MLSLLTTLTTAARKRAAYNRTVAELSALPRNVARDIAVFDIPATARKAVYGY